MKQQLADAAAAMQKLDELITSANKQSASIAATVESLRLKIAESKREQEGKQGHPVVELRG